MISSSCSIHPSFHDMDILHYPKLTHLSQIEENIKGVENCITINHRAPFIYASYENVSSKLFPPVFQYSGFDQLQELFSKNPNEYHRRMLRREVRGLAFDDETKKIMSRTMPKFFNIDEFEESSKKRVEYLLKKALEQHHNQGGDPPYVLLEKLDGSLCSPIIERCVSSDEEHAIVSLSKNNYATALIDHGNARREYTSFKVRMRTKLSHTNSIVIGMEELIYQLGDECSQRNNNANQTEDIKVILRDHLKNIPQLPLMLKELSPEEEEFLVFKIDEEAIVQQDQFLKLPPATQNFIRFCIYWMNRGYTPLFEFFSKDHKIVIDYGDKPFLSLLAIRHTVNGNFLPYQQVKESADFYDIECVKECSNQKVLTAASNGDIEELLKAIRNERGIEGYVLVLNSGWMFKVKSMWYSDIHKTNAYISKGELKEAAMWNYVLESKVDDIIGFVRSEEDRVRLRDFNDKLINYFNNYVEKIQNYTHAIQQELEKDFPNVGYEDIPMKNFTTVARSILSNEPSFILNLLIINKKEQTSLHSLLKDQCVKISQKDLNTVKKMLECTDLEFISRSEMRRREKLAKLNQVDKATDQSQDAQDEYEEFQDEENA
ncbi:hypothetical protein FDP41_001479 [Naegleria fowleri]|uniref:T4 RNA ligase 1-like N-terminal domain-containing protein n=1 Tax=Naegleria fowleri TaxID=5763 RepID=A0A6A5BY91_NAEFO|nr:uncharacterized protein FDP41_001479 [Naegleria fowleri]KAF0979501.1 hypothetical protein FDP41_001479 [Naegleria fowleri]